MNRNMMLRLEGLAKEVDGLKAANADLAEQNRHKISLTPSYFFPFPFLFFFGADDGSGTETVPCSGLAKEVDGLKAANADLAEQNRDLTFFISGTQRLKNVKSRFCSARSAFAALSPSTSLARPSSLNIIFSVARRGCRGRVRMLSKELFLCLSRRLLRRRRGRHRNSSLLNILTLPLQPLRATDKERQIAILLRKIRSREIRGPGALV
jgi:hypothetical protein